MMTRYGGGTNAEGSSIPWQFAGASTIAGHQHPAGLVRPSSADGLANVLGGESGGTGDVGVVGDGIINGGGPNNLVSDIMSSSEDPAALAAAAVSGGPSVDARADDVAVGPSGDPAPAPLSPPGEYGIGVGVDASVDRSGRSSDGDPLSPFASPLEASTCSSAEGILAGADGGRDGGGVQQVNVLEDLGIPAIDLAEGDRSRDEGDGGPTGRPAMRANNDDDGSEGDGGSDGGPSDTVTAAQGVAAASSPQMPLSSNGDRGGRDAGDGDGGEAPAAHLPRVGSVSLLAGGMAESVPTAAHSLAAGSSLLPLSSSAHQIDGDGGDGDGGEAPVAHLPRVGSVSLLAGGMTCVMGAGDLATLSPSRPSRPPGVQLHSRELADDSVDDTSDVDGSNDGGGDDEMSCSGSSLLAGMMMQPLDDSLDVHESLLPSPIRSMASGDSDGIGQYASIDEDDATQNRYAGKQQEDGRGGDQQREEEAEGGDGMRRVGSVVSLFSGEVQWPALEDTPTSAAPAPAESEPFATAQMASPLACDSEISGTSALSGTSARKLAPLLDEAGLALGQSSSVESILERTNNAASRTATPTLAPPPPQRSSRGLYEQSALSLPESEGGGDDWLQQASATKSSSIGTLLARADEDIDRDRGAAAGGGGRLATALGSSRSGSNDDKGSSDDDDEAGAPPSGYDLRPLVVENCPARTSSAADASISKDILFPSDSYSPVFGSSAAREFNVGDGGAPSPLPPLTDAGTGAAHSKAQSESVAKNQSFPSSANVDMSRLDDLDGAFSSDVRVFDEIARAAEVSRGGGSSGTAFRDDGKKDVASASKKAAEGDEEKAEQRREEEAAAVVVDDDDDDDLLDEDGDRWMARALELRDAVRTARTVPRKNGAAVTDEALAFLDAFQGAVEALCSGTGGDDLGSLEYDLDDEEEEDDDDESAAENSFAFSPRGAVVSDRGLQRGTVASRHSGGRRSKSLEALARRDSERIRRGSLRSRRSSTGVPPSLRRILPHVSYLRLVFDATSALLSWATGRDAPTELRAVSSRFALLAEALLGQVSTLLAASPSGATAPFDGDESEFFSFGASQPLALDKGDVGAGEAYASSSGEGASVNDPAALAAVPSAEIAPGAAAAASFRLLLAVLADGAYLLKAAHREMLRSNEERRRTALSDALDGMARRAGELGLDEGDGNTPMNSRAALAAIQLGKRAAGPGPRHGERNGTGAAAGNTADDRGATERGDPAASILAHRDSARLSYLDGLLKWAANVDVVLSDISSPSGIISIGVNGSKKGGDAATYLLRTTVPAILAVGSIEGAENTTAIVMALIRKRRRLAEIFPGKKSGGVAAGPPPKDYEEELRNFASRAVDLYLRYARELDTLVEAKSLDRLLHLSPREKTAATLSAGVFISVILRAFDVNHPILAKIIATVAILIVTERALSRRFRARLADALGTLRLEDTVAAFVPPLPRVFVPREGLQNAVIDSILGNGGGPRGGKGGASAVPPDATFLRGVPGSGTTTVACAVARDSRIKCRFSDGVLWLELERLSPLGYGHLVELYSEMCRQLSVSACPELAFDAAEFDAEQFYLHPNDPEHEGVLMEDLRKGLSSALGLGTRSVLIVVDGLQDASDAKWFRFADNGTDEKKTASDSLADGEEGHPHLVVTTTGEEVKPPNWSVPFRVDPLRHDEAVQLLRKRIGPNSKYEAGELLPDDSDFLPLGVETLSQIVSIEDSLKQQGHDEVDLRSVAASVLSSNDAQDKVRLIFSAGGTIGTVLQLCFSAFATVFFDDSLANRRCDPSVPAKISAAFWDELLTSKELSIGQLVELERYAEAEKDDNGKILPRSAFIIDQLVSLGLLRVHCLTYADGSFSNRYYIAHEQVRRAGIPSDEKRKQGWYVLVILAYQEYLSGSKDSKSSEAGDDEQSFIMRHIIDHMFRGNMYDKSLDLMTSTNFLQNRMKKLGVFGATLSQIQEADHLFQKLKEGDGEVSTLSGKMVHAASAKMCIMSCYERLAQHLSEASGHVDSTKAAVGLFSLGQSLLRASFFNEAFAMYQEAINVCCFSGGGEAVIFRVMALTMHDIGHICHHHKGDRVEAIKSYVESLHYSKYISSMCGSQKVRTLRSLGDANFEQDDYDAALIVYSDALEALNELYGADSMQYAVLLEKVGEAHRKNGDAEKAKKALAEALRILESVPGKKSSGDTAAIIYHLGLTHRDLGDVRLAIDTISIAIDLWEAGKLSQDEKANYATALHDLGILYRQQGDLDDALISYNLALRLREEVFGMNHEDTAHTLHSIGIVYCDKGSHTEALKYYSKSLQLQQKHSTRGAATKDDDMKKFTDALLASQDLHIEAPSVDQIKERCELLFGKGITEKDCCCARVFGCATLMVDNMVVKESKDLDTSAVGSDVSFHPSALLDWIKPLQPFFAAAVKAELSLIDESKSSQPAENRKRLVRFCSYDFSTVKSPVDIIHSSNIYVEQSIDATSSLVGESERLSSVEESSSERGKGNNEIAKLLLVLHAMTSATEGKALREACAQAMPSHGHIWPSSRFFGVAEIYRKEFEAVIARSEFKPGDPDELLTSVSPVRERLSTMISSCVRYHLRRLFDPVPMAYTLPTKKNPAPDLSICRARTHECVALCAPDGIVSNEVKKRDEGPVSLWDRPVSHVFLLALRRVHTYFEAQDEIRAALKDTVDDTGESLKNVTVLSLSEASMQCLRGSGKGRSITDSDLADILHDVHLAHICLSAARASKFLLALLQWPGVDLSIQSAGGWKEIEATSTILTRFRLDKDFHDEAHFALLGDIGKLTEMLQNTRKEITTAARASQRVMQEMWTRFKRDSGKRKKRNANEAIIRQILLEDSTTVVFPQLCIPDD